MSLYASAYGETFVIYVQNHSVWRYNDLNMWPGNSWMNPEYDDTYWKSGMTYIATSEETRGEGVTTVLAGGKPAHPTYYFRRTFTVQDTSKVARMSFNIDYDDAYAIYINGRLVGSSNFNCEWRKHESLCTPYPHNSMIDVSDPNEPRFPRTDLNSEQLGYLYNGTNYIAVAIKQGSAVSTDAAFAMTLYGWEGSGPGEDEGSNTKMLAVAAALIILTSAGAVTVVYSRKKKMGGVEATKAESTIIKEEQKKILEEDTPQAKTKKRVVRVDFGLERGHSYLVLEDAEKRGINIFFNELSKGGYNGLCIARDNPAYIKSEFKAEGVKVLWLTDTTTEKSEAMVYPNPLDISIIIDEFARKNENSLVLLDGLQYLITKNSFKTVLTLISKLKDTIAQTNSILLIPVVKLSLEDKELGLLITELGLLETELDVLNPKDR